MRPLSVERFNALLNPDQGGAQRVAWRRASLCPCRDPHSGAAVQGCPSCAGKGVLWAAPIAAWAGVTGMKAAREWAQFAQFETGDVVISIPSDSPLYAAGESDRVLLLASSEPFMAVLLPDRVALPLPFTAHAVDRAFWLDANLHVVTPPALPTLAADGSLAWPAGGAPPAGVQISLGGRKRPEYYLFRDLPQDRGQFGGGLPRRVVLRKFDLFGR